MNRKKGWIWNMDTEMMRTNEAEGTPATAPDPLLKTTVGKITYLVGVHFSEDAKETMADKIGRMIRREIQTSSV